MQKFAELEKTRSDSVDVGCTVIKAVNILFKKGPNTFVFSNCVSSCLTIFFKSGALSSGFFKVAWMADFSRESIVSVNSSLATAAALDPGEGDTDTCSTKWAGKYLVIKSTIVLWTFFFDSMGSSVLVSSLFFRYFRTDTNSVFRRCDTRIFNAVYSWLAIAVS